MGRVLVLDDDPLVGETVAFISQGIGMETRALTSPLEFFDVLAEWEPSHIVLDLVMPEMDGVEVILQLAKRDCKARIIISSGVGGRVLDAAQRTAREHGLLIVGVLSKPFSPAALKEYLRSDRETASPKPLPMIVEDSVGDSVRVDEDLLIKGLRNNEFKVAYQPIIACADGGLVGFEVLARWPHDSGMILPDHFIAVAESAGLIDQVTRQILRQALTWMASVDADGRLVLSVNISAASLDNIKLADRLEAQCRESGLKPDRVVIELTETAAMSDPVTGLEVLTRLRVKGFFLSIDDFGTGYSAIAQLARMPFSELKVDKSFVITAAESAESRTIIKSMIDLGHSLGLRVVAEGVENEQTLEFLREIGCDFAQGYHICNPLSPEKAALWVQSRARHDASSGPSDRAQDPRHRR